MEKYISQLLEDLNQAAKQPIEPPNYALLNPDHPALEPQYGGILDYIVAWETAPDEPMEKVFGIVAEAFPPPEQLNELQAQQVNEAILKVWEANSIFAVLPEILPSQLILYRELRKKWQTGTVRLLAKENTHINFCYYVHNECPWGMDFCTCKNEDWYNEDVEDMNNSVERNPDDLPF